MRGSCPAGGCLASALLALALLAGAPAPAGAQAPGVRLGRSTGVKVETAALLLSGQEGGPLNLAGHAFALPAAAGGGRLVVVLEVDGAALLAGFAGPWLPLEVNVYALGAAGELRGFQARTVEVELATHAPTLRQGGLRVYLGAGSELRLPAGEYTLRILLRNPATGALGLRSLAATVPDFAERRPRLLALLAPGDGPWVEAGAPDLAGLPARPVAARALVSAEEARLLVLAADLPAELPEARLLVSGPALQAERAARPLSRTASAIAGVEAVELAWRPAELAPGLYDLRASWGPDLLSPQVPLLVAPPAVAAWPQLLPGRAEASARAPGPRSAPGEVLRLSRRELEAALRRALALLAANEAEGVAALDRLESALLRDQRATPDELAEAERHVLARLTRRRPEALVPLLAAYEILFREAQGRRAYLLATHSRDMVHRLADLYVERSHHPEAARLAAKALALLGGHLASLGPGATLAERSFTRAHELDPANATVLHFLAVGAELHGDYRGAINWLERLQKLPAEAPAARLRLAVNRRRLGEPGAALRLLRPLLAPPTDDWLATIAYQETARLLMARGDHAEAEKLLREALARLPPGEKLHLQLALLLDLRGDAPGARDSLAGLELPIAGDQSGRHRYGELPFALLDADRRTLAAAAAARRAVLAAAMGEAAGEEEATP